MRDKGDEILRNITTEKKNAALPLAMAAAGHIIWGFSYLFSKVAMQSASVQVFLSMRFILAFLMLSLLVITGREKLQFKGKNWGPMLALCITEPLYFYFETFGIYYTNATFSGVVMAVVPVVSMAVSAVFLKEYPARRQMLFSILPVVGVILMTVAGQEMGIIQPIGVLLLICGCFTSAVYKTANRGSSDQFTTFERTYYVIAVSMVVFTIDAFRTVDFSFAEYIAPLTSPNAVPYILSVFILSLFCSIVAGYMVNYAAARMSVVSLATVGTLTTITAAFAGVLFLSEPMNAMSLAGTLLILYGIRQVTKSGK